MPPIAPSSRTCPCPQPRVEVEAPPAVVHQRRTDPGSQRRDETSTRECFDTDGARFCSSREETARRVPLVGGPRRHLPALAPEHALRAVQWLGLLSAPGGTAAFRPGTWAGQRGARSLIARVREAPVLRVAVRLLGFPEIESARPLERHGVSLQRGLGRAFPDISGPSALSGASRVAQTQPRTTGRQRDQRPSRARPLLVAQRSSDPGSADTLRRSASRGTRCRAVAPVLHCAYGTSDHAARAPEPEWRHHARTRPGRKFHGDPQRCAGW